MHQNNYHQTDSSNHCSRDASSVHRLVKERHQLDTEGEHHHSSLIMASPEGNASSLRTNQLFDSVGHLYDVAFEDRTEQHKSVDWLLRQLKPGSRILDVGCGPGAVAAKMSEAGHDVLGIDVSEVMVAAAKKQAPKATFEKRDFLREFAAQPGSFDAITMYFTLISDVSQAQIQQGMQKVYTLLREGGVFCYASVNASNDKAAAHFLGRPMVASGFNKEETLNVLQKVGFTIEQHTENLFQPKWVDGLQCSPDQVSKEPHIFVYARKSI